MNKRERKESEYCYVTRDTCSYDVEVYPASVGIRKFHGCVQFGAAWNSSGAIGFLKKEGNSEPVTSLSRYECRKRFGFYPRKGTAWDIDGKKRTRIDMDMLFSN